MLGANMSATGSAAQLLQPGSNPSLRTLPGSGARTPENIHAALSAAPAGYVDEGSHTSLNDTPYPRNDQLRAPSSNGHESISEKYRFASDPFVYGHGFSEADDELHTPDPKRDKKADKGGTFFTSRGALNLGCLTIVIVGLLILL